METAPFTELLIVGKIIKNSAFYLLFCTIVSCFEIGKKGMLDVGLTY